MYKDPTEFRARFKAYKEGKMPYENGLPRYAPGKIPETVDDATLDFIINHEGFKPNAWIKDPVTGKMLLGSGIDVNKYKELFRKTGKWSAEDNRRAVRDIVIGNRPTIRRIFGDKYNSLTPAQKGVIDDIAFNIGAGALANSSPKFVAAVLSGNMEEAKRQMDWGNHLARGLVNRNKDRLTWWDSMSLTPVEVPAYIARPQQQQLPPVVPELKPYLFPYETQQLIKTLSLFNPTIMSRPSSRRLPNDLLWSLVFDDEPKQDDGLLYAKNGKLPRYGGGKDGYRYIKNDETGGWDRITNDDEANLMSDLVVTPRGIRNKFDYESNPNYVAPRLKNEVVKQDNDLWTRQQVEKANNTRTWRSDVADQFHNLGEAALMASNFVPFEGEIMQGANWLRSLAKGYLMHPNYKTVYHGSPYPFDIKNAWVGTPFDMGLHAGPFNTAKGMSEGGVVYKLRIPKENAEIIDLGRNGVEHFDTHRFYDARPYIYKDNPGYSYYLTTPGDDFRMSIFRKYGMDPKITQNPHPNGFPKLYLHTNNDAYINILNEEFPNLDGPERIKAIKLSGLAEGNKNGYGQILDKNYARTLNEEGAKLLSNNGYKVLKYHNANPYELGGDAYMITDPSIIEIIKDTPNLKPLLYPTVNSMLYLYNKIRGYKNGKSPIHIKPANRGKFTALKKRTGHSASWFKLNGTPAQKKMATFALNARKWKH